MPGNRVLARALACAIVALCALAVRHALAARPLHRSQGARTPTLHAARALPIADAPVAGAPAPVTASGPRPVTLYLHGICGNPNNGCPYFRNGVDETSTLLCPRAPVECPRGGASWGSLPGAQRTTVEHALERAAREHPGDVDVVTPGVLIGFSQGAYVAQSLVRAWPGRFRGVAYVGAFVRPDATALRAAGVRRVLFAAGARDMTYRALRAAADRLAAQGFSVRFLDLGPVGHSYVPAPGTPGWHDALAWLEAA